MAHKLELIPAPAALRKMRKFNDVSGSKMKIISHQIISGEPAGIMRWKVTLKPIADPDERRRLMTALRAKDGYATIFHQPVGLGEVNIFATAIEATAQESGAVEVSFRPAVTLAKWQQMLAGERRAYSPTAGTLNVPQ